jgi:hypothetical protein
MIKEGPPIKFIAILVLMLVGILLFFILLDQLTGGLIRGLIGSILFWIPFGSIFTSLTHGMSAIPG